MFTFSYMNSSKHLHSFRNSLKQFLPEIKTVPTEIMYIHPAQSLSCFIMKPWHCWTWPRISPGLAWLSLMGILGSSWPLQCSVVLVLGTFSKQEIPEQGAVLDFLATQKHEQKDLSNFLLNCPVSQASHSLSIVHTFDFNTNKNLFCFSTFPSFKIITDLCLSGLLLHLVHFTQKKIPLNYCYWLCTLHTFCINAFAYSFLIIHCSWHIFSQMLKYFLMQLYWESPDRVHSSPFRLQKARFKVLHVFVPNSGLLFICFQISIMQGSDYTLHQQFDSIRAFYQ